MPTRSIWVFETNMGLCSRCFGIYLSLLLVGTLRLINKKAKLNLVFATILFLPMLLDLSTISFGLREGNNFVRFVSGFFAGTGLGSICFGILTNLFPKPVQLLPND